MSGDAQVRTLQRRWQQTGDVADERRLLQARVRRGELGEDALALIEPVWSGVVERKWLDLLAYAGDPGAVAIVDEEPLVELACYYGDFGGVNVVFDDDPSWADLEDWAYGLQHWNPGGGSAVAIGFFTGECVVALEQMVLLDRLLEGPNALSEADADYAEGDRILIEEQLSLVVKELPHVGAYLKSLRPEPADKREFRYWGELADEAEMVSSRSSVDFSGPWSVEGPAPRAIGTVRGYLRFHFGFSQ